jgi:hypothetical protein
MSGELPAGSPARQRELRGLVLPCDRRSDRNEVFRGPSLHLSSAVPGQPSARALQVQVQDFEIRLELEQEGRAPRSRPIGDPVLGAHTIRGGRCPGGRLAEVIALQPGHHHRQAKVLVAPAQTRLSTQRCSERLAVRLEKEKGSPPGDDSSLLGHREPVGIAVLLVFCVPPPGGLRSGVHNQLRPPLSIRQQPAFVSTSNRPLLIVVGHRLDPSTWRTSRQPTATSLRSRVPTNQGATRRLSNGTR